MCLMEVPKGRKIAEDREDSVEWIWGADKVFSFNLYYKELVGKGANRVPFFAWSVSWGGILSMDNLQKGVPAGQPWQIF